MDLPKIIWGYWDIDSEKNIPTNIKQILNNNSEKLKPNWEFIFLNNNSIKKYLDLEEGYEALFDCSARKSDFIRLKLLEAHGGIWLDAGIIVNDEKAIEEIYNEAIAKKIDLAGFYLPGCEINNNPETYIESWFIASPKKNDLISQWLLELEKAIRIGIQKYWEDFSSYDSSVQSQCINQHGFHLCIHLCLQKVLSKSTSKYNILLHDAYKDMFKIHKECGWNIWCIQNKLLNESHYLKDIKYIKLRAPDRPGDLTNYFL